MAEPVRIEKDGAWQASVWLNVKGIKTGNNEFDLQDF